MKYSWSTNLYDYEGDIYDKCVMVFVGEDAIIKFKNAGELEDFAQRILRSIVEIKSLEPSTKGIKI